MVRDPPRKSEQACRAVRCSRGQRAQRRRRSKFGACIERRQRNGRRRRHSLWIHGPQRKRLRRVLENAVPSSGGREEYSLIENEVAGNEEERTRTEDHRKCMGERRKAEARPFSSDCTTDEQLQGKTVPQKDLDMVMYEGAEQCTVQWVTLACKGHIFWIPTFHILYFWITGLDLLSQNLQWTYHSLMMEVMQYNVALSSRGLQTSLHECYEYADIEAALDAARLLAMSSASGISSSCSS